MKRILAKSLLLLTLLVCFSACERYVAPDNTARRTILVYMEARNDLMPNSFDDLAEIRLAQIPADCRVLVYQSTRGIAPKLIEISNGKEVILKQYPEDVSAVDPEHFRSIVTVARLIAPAREYGLVMWSHSSGWQQTLSKARGFGLENGGKQMSVSDLADAIEGCGIDFIIFDTCYMGCVEVAYELRNAARYMVASVCEVHEDGMPYHRTLPEMCRPDLLGGLKSLIDITVSSNSSFGGCPATLSLIDLSKIDELAQAFKSATGELPEDFVPQAFSKDVPFKYLLFDFGQYFNAIGGDRQALADAVLHEKHSASIWGIVPIIHCSGLSVYLPQFSSGYNHDSYGYSSLDWHKFITNN